MKKHSKEICLVIGSKDLFGTERRYLKIISALHERNPEVVVNLVVNYKLFSKMKSRSEYSSIIDRKLSDRSLIVVPDSVASLRKSRNITSFFRTFFKVESFHLLLRARDLAFLRKIMGKKSSIEVTSVDIARAVAEKMSISILTSTKFLSVSQTVGDKFVSELEKRKCGLSKKVDMQVATLPYHQAPPRHEYLKDKLIVSACRFIPRKNVALFAEALQLALPRMENWRVAILGQGPDEELIREKLARYISRDQVIVSYEPSIKPYLERAALFVSLIEPDNYPSQSVLEAMDMNIALLLSDTGTSSRFIDQERPNGVLAPLNAAAIADALVELCSDEQRLREYGENSRLVSDERFSESAFLEQMLAFHGIDADAR